MREARAAAALRHPNVAAVYHFGVQEENGQFFCAMELVEGETLETRVRRTGPLEALTVVEIGLQVASALAAAEKQGLVHRDLKPANLMLVAADDETSSVTVKVIDFGVAKALAESPDAMGLTHGGFVGTPAFASPEQFTSAPVDVRSDIYSLGATLCFFLPGKCRSPAHPWKKFAPTGRCGRCRWRMRAARAPARLITLLASMLAPEPAARPGIRELTVGLQRCRANLLDRWKTARPSLSPCFSWDLLAVLASSAFPQLSPREGGVPEKSIAVLPFHQVGAAASDTYFADGVQDQILSKLASVAELKVIARSSTEKYSRRNTGREECFARTRRGAPAARQNRKGGRAGAHQRRAGGRPHRDFGLDA